MRRHSGRILALALGVSLLLHVALFLVLPWRERLLAPKPRPPVIDAALIEIPAAAPATSHTPLPHPALRATLPELGGKVKPRPARAPAPAPEPIQALPAPRGDEPPVGLAANPELAAAASPSGSGHAGAGAGAPSVATAGEAAVGPGIGSADDDALARIQALLAARAAHCYPPAAARLGLTGTSQVHFCVRDGAAAQISIARGSGEAMLDRAAAECVVGEAGPLPAVERCLDVPVRFVAR